MTASVLKLHPIRGVSGTVTLPGSKSLSNRMLLLSAIAEGETELANVLDSDDVAVMVTTLRQLTLDETKLSRTVVVARPNISAEAMNPACCSVKPRYSTRPWTKPGCKMKTQGPTTAR